MPEQTIKRNHMAIPWHDYIQQKQLPITQASLSEKASVIGRIGLMLLSCGTGAWRVRSSMNTISECLGVVCSADIGLMSVEYTCFDGTESFSQSLCLTNTGVNTSKLNRLERFVADFPEKGLSLGGGLWEMFFAFLGAGVGNTIRCKLTKHHFTLFLCIVTSVAAACLIYAGCLRLAEMYLGISSQHEAGYICSMLFIVPGFPFITSGIDLAKLDMRSGLERLAYAVLVVMVATLAAWMMALLLHLTPVDFMNLHLNTTQYLVLRLLFSFCGVFGFSVMFNSPVKIAATAAAIGAVSNTLRLELVDLSTCPPAIAAFLGALTAGLLASLLKAYVGYPRVSITVPSIVIMVPGLYLYKAIYNLGIMSLSDAAVWMTSALLIIAALPLGLIFARIVTDKTFRYCT